jgi:hypothetical protein
LACIDQTNRARVKRPSLTPIRHQAIMLLRATLQSL